MLGVPLETASSDALEAWWDGLQVQAGSRSAYRAHATGFYRWAVRQRLRDDDPTIRLLSPRLRRRLPRPITDQNLRFAIDHAGEPIRAWLLLAAYMGLRACEIAALRRDDIEGGMLIVRDGKGGKQRAIPLHPTVEAELELCPESGWLFPHHSGDGPMTANTVSARANRFLHKAGLVETLHMCRHWFGTNVYRNSLDLRLTQEQMGHASPITTAGYAAVTPGRAVEIVTALRIPANAI